MRDFTLQSDTLSSLVQAADAIRAAGPSDIAGPRSHAEEVSPATLDTSGEEVVPAVFGPVTFVMDVRWHGIDKLPPLPEAVMVTEGPNGFPRPKTIPAVRVLAVAGIDDVRAETLRRLINAFGARDQAHLAIKVQDAVIRAGALTDKRVSGLELTAAEEAEATFLRQAQKHYLSLKANGNRLEALATAGQLPADFRDDAHWGGSA